MELLAGLPVPPAEVLLRPRIGEDACAIEVPGGVLVAATDPITFTAQEIGRFSVIVNANDVAVMGVRPRWFLAVILLPSGSTQAMVREVFASRRRSRSTRRWPTIRGSVSIATCVSPAAPSRSASSRRASRSTPGRPSPPGALVRRGERGPLTEDLGQPVEIASSWSEHPGEPAREGSLGDAEGLGGSPTGPPPLLDLALQPLRKRQPRFGVTLANLLQ